MIYLKDKILTAKKDHICNWCKLKIPKDTKYRYQFLKDEYGEVGAWKSHLDCDFIFNNLLYIIDDKDGWSSDEFDEIVVSILKDTVYPYFGEEWDYEDELNYYSESKSKYLHLLAGFFKKYKIKDGKVILKE